LFLTGFGHIVNVLAGFMGEYLDRPACSIVEHSGSQNSCQWVRRIYAVVGIRQGLIGHDAPVMPRVLHGHSGYGAFEGHRKEDVASKVSDPSFTNLTQRSDGDKKSMLVGCLSDGGDAH